MRSLCPGISALVCILIPLSPSAATAQEPKADVKPYIFNRAKVLCIGIDQYRFLDEAKYAEKDAKATGDLLHDLYGFHAEFLLGLKATKSNILAKLDSYSQEKLPGGEPNPQVLGEKDVLIIYFAGHGQVINVTVDPKKPGGREGFLLPYDAKLTLNDFRNPDDWYRQAIAMKELLKVIEGMKALHVLVVVDCCCSGFMTQRGDPLSFRHDLQFLLKNKSRAVFAATTDLQAALPDEKSKHGHFTKALLDELEAWSKQSEAASLTDVFDSIRFQVGRSSKGKMIPQMNARIGDSNGEFIFLPKSLKKGDVEFVAKVALGNEPVVAGRGHILTKIQDRTLERENRKTKIEDVIEAFQSPDYRFATDFAAKDRYWRQKAAILNENAANGDVLAMATLHYCYAKGLGVEKDPVVAHRWARAAYESELPAGKHVLARCLLLGIQEEKNEEAADRLFAEAAAKDFPLSLHVVGDRLLAKASKDIELLTEAEAKLKKAGELGVADAKYSLAKIYLGIVKGGKLDPKKGVQLLEEAANANLAAAHQGLYETYRITQDRPVLPGFPPQDLDKARTHLVRAAELGFAFSQQLLASQYYREEPFSALIDNPKDYKLAFHWASLAARQSQPNAHLLLSFLYEKGSGTEVNIDKMKFHLEESVRLNHSKGMYFLAVRLIVVDSHYKQDPDRAFTLAQASAAQGDSNGHYLLGHMYQKWRHPTTGKFGFRNPVDFEYHGWSHHIIHNFFQAFKRGHPHPDITKYLQAYKKWSKFERERGAAAFHDMASNNKLPSFVFEKLRNDYPETAKEFAAKFELGAIKKTPTGKTPDDSDLAIPRGFQDLLDREKATDDILKGLGLERGVIPGTIRKEPKTPDAKLQKPSDGKTHDIPAVGLFLESELGAKDELDSRRFAPGKVFFVKMKAGGAYQIDMKSKQLDSFLRIEDSSGTQLAEDDDGGDNLNARIVFEPKADGIYRIFATSYDRNLGRFALSIKAR